MPDKGSRPFPIQLEVEFLDRLSEPVREGRAKSVSEIIRTALERYDFANMIVMRPSMLQISVRLAAPIRQNLKRISRTKHASVGQLVRAAVEAYLPQLETGATAQLEIPDVPTPTAAESVLAPPPKRKRKPKKKSGKPAPKKKPVAKRKSKR
ncbi:Ribbon-helix-helix protein, copG family [Lacunisphaera limnophila]|uniref:Ribbon-helix-helix protein, copG family n=1 Tax=Lacunisphaera limnophila TaxID=1838286 RepID=A0A1D8AYL5_9BACT|nr:ribbon-helix-helix protein, CopG family [Lacunisphaera limnophila]AOS45990.1 Ribbon-helix-helix protein, copG family [Lacunisphaera limnophila]